MKKGFILLLRALTAGLAFYGYFSANVYWNYVDDWYYSMYGERLAFSHDSNLRER